MDGDLLAQFQQINTAYATIVPSLIQKLVMRGSLSGAEAGELFREAEQNLASGPAEGALVDEGLARLRSMSAWADAAKRQGQ